MWASFRMLTINQSEFLSSQEDLTTLVGFNTQKLGMDLSFERQQKIEYKKLRRDTKGYQGLGLVYLQEKRN